MSTEQPARRRPWWMWPAGTAGTAVFIVLLIWGPWWIEGHHLKDKSGGLISSAGIIVTGFRTMLLAIAAGIFTALGLWYTRKKHELEQRQFEQSQQQFAEGQKQFETTLRETQERDLRQAGIAREGQVTGRYVEAVKLLGSDNIHARLGGIYGLERVMKDSDRDHQSITEVLSAFIRNKLQEAAASPSEIHGTQETQDATHLPLQRKSRSSGELLILPEDTKAAFTVLGRRDPTQRRALPAAFENVQLDHRDLIGVSWPEANFERANFQGANLRAANLLRATLDDANLAEATLTNASLNEASLQNATLKSSDLVRSNLSGARLDHADMRDAIMNKANFTDASLFRARLDGASLNGARFERAHLTGARLKGARLADTNFRAANLTRTDLTRASLRRADFDGAKLHHTALDEADLRNANLEKAIGLEVENLIKARIDRTTSLPPGFSNNLYVQVCIDRWEDEANEEARAGRDLEEPL
ncbi:pentapeptide repeat-containing protein [Streptomyces sp. MBT67]|uniref:pentapeptide repeat-containing protein n=1 Tax=unclassified Streptomyces TaxID=2593676 RepID=UPI00190D3F58|nr:MULTISPECIES: pentapeptide repeat-containing protein [unclassified Streptomyces]MBK3532124.1 pentapeptide repeat-containing protein [Streptomyces sp. MBT72]MBK3538785.1 pentapeptide repeat-containing protein [Streptomyces sp. MBT67]MBK3553287.1 pentapeptide repeat-containing protein [Streptomyces sp. MBT61]MBK6029038.1 pentapeptide repeat-containing protein [Streptomyces sp. MBT59]